MSIYRKIYEQHHGLIPVDENGRTYEIHHIDGNHKNNKIENLKAVTIQEHYDIHYSQGDWAACILITRAMNISPTEKSKLAKLNHQRRINNNSHPFLGGSIQKENNIKKVKEGTHNFLGGKIQKENAQRRVADGTHHWLSGDLQRVSTNRRLEEGTHPFQFNWICEHCGKSGKNKAMYNRWHNGKCLLEK
jgi:hypothetical protein